MVKQLARKEKQKERCHVLRVEARTWPATARIKRQIKEEKRAKLEKEKVKCPDSTRTRRESGEIFTQAHLHPYGIPGTQARATRGRKEKEVAR